MDIIEVYEAGSTLALIGGGTGIVEKAIIGANATVQYQLICYQPERHQTVVADFEVSPVEGKVTKCPIGFAKVTEPAQKEVTILVDKDEKVVHIDAPNEILIGMGQLTDEQAEEYRKLTEGDNGKTEEQETEEEKAE